MEKAIKISFNKSTFLQEKVRLPLSKSVCNRALILNYFSGEPFPTKLISTADDSIFLHKALLSGSTEIETGEGGTTFRFLLAFFAIHTQSVIALKPTGPMLKRPVKPLVDALNQVGCNIEYSEKIGFAPVIIKPKNNIQITEIKVDTTESSQFISAILLACFGLDNTVKIEFSSEIVSALYLKLTAQLIENAGGTIQFFSNYIVLTPPKIKKPFSYVEPDWSAAQYPLSMLAILGKGNLFFEGLFKNQLQGDVATCEIFADFGIDFLENVNGISAFANSNFIKKSFLERDFYNNPDVAQAWVCCAFALGITCKATGLKTLLNKETNRILALKTELEKLGANVEIGLNWILVSGEMGSAENIEINTHSDHRMAMSFAPLAIKTKGLTINAPYVVTKSFPNFWKLCSDLGFQF